MVVASGVAIDEFLRIEDEKPALEYARGEVFQKPIPTRFHSILTRYFTLVLSRFLEQAALGEVFPELRCIFDPPGRQRAYVPDLVYVSNERLMAADRFLRTAPDLAVEILSPGQNIARLFAKTVLPAERRTARLDHRSGRGDDRGAGPGPGEPNVERR